MAGEPALTIVGFAGGDPDLKFTQAGKAYVTLSVGTTNRVKNGEEWESGATTWFRCKAWGRIAEGIADQVQKGVKVIATGRMLTEEWEDREGQKRSTLVLNVDDMGLALSHQPKEGRSKASGNGKTTPWGNPDEKPAVNGDDDIPPF